MGEEEKKPNPIELVPDLQEEILLRVPLKSILRFKIVSKRWRSTLESRRFAERRSKIQKKPKILAAGDHKIFEGDEEVEMFYLNSDDAATKPSLTCDGLVCVPVPGWYNILNPSTGESIRFPSGPDPVKSNRYEYRLWGESWWITFPRDWALGFGKDIVNGSYKIVRMYFEPNYYCEILDLSIGEWLKLANSPPHSVEARRKSAYVNGSIYWLEVYPLFMVLALDLHTEKFRKIPPPPSASRTDQLVNLEDRLTIATTFGDPHPLTLEIWRLDAQEETWSMSHFIRLDLPFTLRMWDLLFWPVTVSKRGNVFFHDNVKRLFKYYPETNRLCCVSSDICIVSSFVENLVPFERSELKVPLGCPELKTSPSLDDVVPNSRISKTFTQIKLHIPCILTSTVASLMIFRFFFVSSRSRY